MVRPVDGLGELSAQELDTGGVGMSSCKVERCSSISVHADAGGRIEAALQDLRGAWVVAEWYKEFLGIVF